MIRFLSPDLIPTLFDSTRAKTIRENFYRLKNNPSKISVAAPTRDVNAAVSRNPVYTRAGTSLRVSPRRPPDQENNKSELTRYKIALQFTLREYPSRTNRSTYSSSRRACTAHRTRKEIAFSKALLLIFFLSLSRVASRKMVREKKNNLP